ncbi:MAG: hypothetical protein V3V82_04600 [Acidimicrobiia bacterium]
MTDASTYANGEGLARRELFRRGAIGGGLVVAALAAPGLTGVAKAQDGKSEGTETIVLDIDTHGFADFESTNADAGLGAFYVSGDILAEGTTEPVIGVFHCWGYLRAADGLGVVNQEFNLTNRGKILIAGVESDAPRSVTGGTGDFASARGEGLPDIATFDFLNSGKFRISFGLNGVTVTKTAPAESLMYGTSANRSGGSPLNGATISGEVFVWLSPLRPEDVNSIRNVDFLVNGKFRHREGRAPYDMIEGGDDAATAPWNSRDVSNGRTTVSAVVVSTDGSTREVEAVFQVAN